MTCYHCNRDRPPPVMRTLTNRQGTQYWCTFCLEEYWRTQSLRRTQIAIQDARYKRTYRPTAGFSAIHPLTSEEYAQRQARRASERRHLDRGIGDKVCEHETCRPIDRQTVWLRDEGRCRIKLVCNGTLVAYEDMQLDHIIPLSRSGLHCYENVQTSCAPCNLKKSNKIL